MKHVTSLSGGERRQICRIICFSSVLVSLCFTGCCWHCYVQMRGYFAYPTVVTVAPIIPQRQKYPITHLCMRSKSNQLENTFNPLNSYNNCLFRKIDSSQLESVNCSDVFSIQQFTMINNVCVMMKPKIEESFSFKQPIRSQYSRRILYQFTMSFANNTEITPLVSMIDNPLDSYYFSMALSTQVNSLYHLSYRIFNFKRMPAPYDTNCQLAKDSFNKSTLVIQNTDKFCHQILTTDFISFPQFYPNNLTAFRLEVTSQPINVVESNAKIDLSYFLLLIGSTIGLWLGASVFTSIQFIGLLKLRLSRSLCTVKSNLSFSHNQINQLLYRAIILQNLSSKRREKKIIIHRIYSAITYALLLSQICSLVISYAEYKTSENVRYMASFDQSSPSLILCFDLPRFLSKEDPTDDDIEPTVTTFNEYYSSFDSLFGNITLSEIFNQTESIEIIHHCSVRQDNGMKVLSNTSQCYEYLNIKQFYLSHNMCYTISLVNNIQFNEDTIYHYKTYPGIVYSISLNQIIPIKMQQISVILNEGLYPYLSKDFSASLHLPVINQSYLVSHETFSSQLLPYPYDTMCYDWPSGHSDCTAKCLISNGVKKIERLPYSEIITEPLDMHLLTYTDLATDVKLASQWQRIQSGCNELCKLKYCKLLRAKTHVSQYFMSDWFLSLTVQSSTGPLLESNSVARIALTDLIFQIFCSMAFWIGFHGLTLVPVSLIIVSKSELHFAIARKIQKVKNICSRLRERKCKHIIPIPVSPQVTSRKHISIGKNFIHLICLVGFVGQSYFASTVFFEYPAAIRTSRSSLDHQEVPSLYVCMDLLEITSQWDVDQLVGYSKQKVMNLTVSELFKLTPSSNDLIDSCGERGLVKSNLSQYVSKLLYIRSDSSYCNRMFQTKKMLTQDLVCYYINPLALNFTDLRMSNDIGFRGNFYDIALNNSIKSSSFFTFLAFNRTTITLRSFGVNIAQNSNISNSYELTYVKFEEQCIPKPYSYPGYTTLSASICQRKCIGQHHQHSPELFITDDTINRPFDSSNDPKTLAVVKMCKSQCNLETSCETSNEYCLTIVRRATDLYSFTGGVKLSVKATDFPVTMITFLPVMILTEYILIIGSIFAIWFGLSVLDLDPMKSQFEGVNEITPDCYFWHHIYTLSRQMLYDEINACIANTCSCNNPLKKMTTE